MNICNVHCLFEQSGTFKREFEKLGICAKDYDILNDFGQTDHVCDLFAEIDKAYDGQASIFDNMTPEDLIMAFYPCTRFEDQSILCITCNGYAQRNWPPERKVEYSMQIHNELHYLYTEFCKLVLISMRGGHRLIVENPYSTQHYLQRYFPIKPALIDKDRTQDGDYYRKPTQFWFINCTPEANLVFEPIEDTPKCVIEYASKADIDAANTKVKRSMIHPQYARRFILRYIGPQPHQ